MYQIGTPPTRSLTTRATRSAASEKAIVSLPTAITADIWRLSTLAVGAVVVLFALLSMLVDLPLVRSVTNAFVRWLYPH
jgi:hypothetical protein